MRFETARKTLQRDAEWLGITLGELLRDLETYPLAHKLSTVAAYRVYKDYQYV